MDLPKDKKRITAKQKRDIKILSDYLYQYYFPDPKNLLDETTNKGREI